MLYLTNRGSAGREGYTRNMDCAREVPVKLFDEMPRIEGEHLILREMAASDAPALSELAHSDEVRRFLPTFLYEQLGDDPVATIEHMREKCFDTKESILLAICDRAAPDVMMGIAEIYAYEERKPKASIGVRILEAYWGRGIATEVAALLKRYLIEEAGVRTITAHVMVDNKVSPIPLLKCGFRKLYPGCVEDWGRGEPVLVDKYVFKRRWMDDHQPTGEES